MSNALLFWEKKLNFADVTHDGILSSHFYVSHLPVLSQPYGSPFPVIVTEMARTSLPREKGVTFSLSPSPTYHGPRTFKGFWFLSYYFCVLLQFHCQFSLKLILCDCLHFTFSPLSTQTQNTTNPCWFRCVFSSKHHLWKPFVLTEAFTGEVGSAMSVRP